MICQSYCNWSVAFTLANESGKKLAFDDAVFTARGLPDCVSTVERPIENGIQDPSVELPARFIPANGQERKNTAK